MKIDINKIKQRLLALNTKKSIQFIVLFGSIATGKNKLSDINVVILRKKYENIK
jgi:predicted nucleotidyltransferase